MTSHEITTIETRVFERCAGKLFGEGRWDVADEWTQLISHAVDLADPEEALFNHFVRGDYRPVRARKIATTLMAIYYGRNL